MSQHMGEEARNSIRALCDEIAVAHELDDEVRKELRGHIEDKVLGYLTGDETVSEADAVILAREHFGDRARLKEMLSEVHHQETGVSLYRRLMAAAIVTMWITYAAYLVEGLGVLVVGRIVAYALPPEAAVPSSAWLKPFTFVAVLTFVWRAFVRMKCRAAEGESLWFEQWSIWSLGAAFVLLLFVVGPVVHSANSMLTALSGLSLRPEAFRVHGFWPVVIWLACIPCTYLCVLGIAWLWWCDSTPRRRTLLVRTALNYSAFVWLTLAIESLSGARLRLIPIEQPLGDPATTAGPGWLARHLPGVTSADSSYVWYWQAPSFGDIAGFGPQFPVVLLLGLVAWGAYEFGSWALKKRRLRLEEL